MNRIETQIKEMYQKAFYDIIDETIASKNPDYEWIVSLYAEIKNRLIRYIKKESKTYNQIDEQFDVTIFRQMIENDVFNVDSLFKLINMTFYWIETLQSPARDQTTKEAKDMVLNASPEKMVSTFIKEVNGCIDLLDEDFENFIKISNDKK
jgi:hypothetical protein